MQTSYLSSGNVTADRRYEYAQALLKEEAFGEAADLLEQTLELAPHWAACWFALGEARSKIGEPARAIEAFRKCLECLPEDPFGARLHLHRLGVETDGDHAAYVAALFDQYAPRFDTHLVETLRYRGPRLIRDLIVAEAGERVFEHFVDLGCGTGLMARALEGRYLQASGVDLSVKMVQIAAKTGLYAAVSPGDMVTMLEALPAQSADLILAADVFVYVGDLAAVFKAARRALGAQGLFGFSVQAKEGEGFALGEDLRFAHSQAYLMDLAKSNHFNVLRLESASTRQDKGRDVPGLLMILNSYQGAK